MPVRFRLNQMIPVVIQIIENKRAKWIEEDRVSVECNKEKIHCRDRFRDFDVSGRF